MAEMATIVRNTCRTPRVGDRTFQIITRPNRKQAKALALIDAIKL